MHTCLTDTQASWSSATLALANRTWFEHRRWPGSCSARAVSRGRRHRSASAAESGAAKRSGVAPAGEEGVESLVPAIERQAEVVIAGRFA
jgi:hypothetical protein